MLVSAPSSKRHYIFYWLITALDLLSAGAYAALAQINGPGRIDWSALSFAAITISGLVIIYKQPRNRVGWLLMTIGLVNILFNFFAEYAYYALVTRPGQLPGGAFFSWLSATWWLLAQPLSVFAILFFPDGRPPTRRWWALVWAILAITVPIYLYLSVLLWPFRGPPLLNANIDPDIQAALGPQVWKQFAVLTFFIWEPTLIIGMTLAVIAQLLRFKRSSGIERLQMKWILLVMIIVPVNIAFSMLPISKVSPLTLWISNFLAMISTLGFPVAMAFAVTRYHLYDIDVIIRRTLLYGAITIFLALVYFGSVVLLQSLFSRLDGQQSPVVIVLSTLLIAALFSPLRARFQRVIDKRFYRRQYNSELVLERFSAGLRSEVNLDAINNYLLSAVEESLQPDECALWLVAREKRDAQGLPENQSSTMPTHY